MNYTTLQEQVANHFVSTELVPFVPTAVELAEAEMNRTVRAREMLSRSFSSVSGQFAALPDDYLEVRTVFIDTAGTSHRLEFVTFERMQELREQQHGKRRPCYYTVVGNDLEFLPVPAGATPVDVTYYQRIPALADDNLTNWLIDKHPDMYLYGTLMQASPYLDKDRRIPTWQALYQAGLEGLRIQNERSEYSGGTLKVRARSL